MSRTTRYSDLGKLAFGLVYLAAHATAGQVCHTLTVPLTSTDYDVEIAIPRFDTALGTLQSITVSLDVESIAASQVESIDATSFVGDVVPGVLARVKASNGTILASATAYEAWPHTLPSYDGTLDFAGASGETTPSTALPDAVGSGSTGDSGILTLYAGTPGNPGPSGTRVSVASIGTVTGVGDVVITFSSQASVTVTVCFVYLSRISSLCFGDGTGTACPCSNEGPAGAGCLNSYGWGSVLSGTGGAAVSADSLVLSATVPGSTATLFFQGTGTPSGGAGALFGDGLRCTDGTVIRLVTTAGVGGVAQFPASGDPLVSVAGELTGAGTRYYQA